MKTIVTLAIILLIASGSFAAKTIKGNSNTFLNEYKVSQISDNLFELSYANSTEKFTVEVCPKEAECCYLVRGENIEVMYLCNEQGMGLRKMPLKDQHLSTKKYCDLVNCEQFRNQSLLTPNKKNTKKALGIIACFFPDVINETSRDIVYNPEKVSNSKKLTAHN